MVMYFFWLSYFLVALFPLQIMASHSRLVKESRKITSPKSIEINSDTFAYIEVGDIETATFTRNNIKIATANNFLTRISRTQGNANFIKLKVTPFLQNIIINPKATVTVNGTEFKNKIKIFFSGKMLTLGGIFTNPLELALLKNKSTIQGDFKENFVSHITIKGAKKDREKGNQKVLLKNIKVGSIVMHKEVDCEIIHSRIDNLMACPAQKSCTINWQSDEKVVQSLIKNKPLVKFALKKDPLSLIYLLPSELLLYIFSFLENSTLITLDNNSIGSWHFIKDDNEEKVITQFPYRITYEKKASLRYSPHLNN